MLYESALTVMMRLVFLFCAEERELIPSKPFPVYEQNYSVSTICKQLREMADQHGEELLERRFDAWPRLLAAFRAVYGGLAHDDAHMPAYGGSLFDPDRFPFLEGRKAGTTWREAEANPLPVDNRTVLHLLEALQLLQVKVPGGGPAEARRLSFRALDIEQIGHVYEGLLDHTARRATEPYLGLAGTRDKEPEIPLAELERLAAKGEDDLLKFLKDETGRSLPALKKGLQRRDRRPARPPLPHRLPGRRGPVGAGAAVRRAGAARHVRLPGRHPAGERLRHGGDRPALQRHALHAPEPDRADRPVHAGAAGLRRPGRGEAEGRVEAEVGGGTARPQDLRHGLRLGGVSGPGGPLHVRAAHGSVGRQCEGGQDPDLTPGITPEGETIRRRAVNEIADPRRSRRASAPTPCGSSPSGACTAWTTTRWRRRWRSCRCGC